MSSTLAHMIAIEVAELGYSEGSGNVTKYGAWIGANGRAWCASFQSWCLHEAGISGHRSASAQALVDSFPTGHTAKVGALAGYHIPGGHAGINHVGLVTGVASGHIHAIEGNTSDQVLRRIRSKGLVVKYGYPKYATTAVPDPPAQAPSTPVSLMPCSTLYRSRAHDGTLGLVRILSIDPARETALVAWDDQTATVAYSGLVLT